MSKTYSAGTNALWPLSYTTQGGHQPPGSNKSARYLVDSFVGESAAAVFAGEQTTLEALDRVALWTDGAKATRCFDFDMLLADRLDKGSDWVRVNLTANELLAKIKIDCKGDDAPTATSVEISFSASDLLTIKRPTDASLNDAVSALLDLQAGGVKNRDEIVGQANDAGLAIVRALTLNPIRHRHFLYLFDVLELVLAPLLYGAKLHLNVPRPSAHPAGKKISTVVPVPNHQSFPSGHASYAWAMVELVIGLAPLTPEQQTYLRTLAARIARNREFAGLHTAMDSEAGKLLGVSLGKWIAESAKDSGAYPKLATLVAQAQRGWTMRDNEM